MHNVTEDAVRGLLLNDRFIVANGFLELVLLHEERVGDVEFPDGVVAAELGRLLEDGLDCCIVLTVPVDARLGHQHRHVPLQSLVVSLQ